MHLRQPEGLRWVWGEGAGTEAFREWGVQLMEGKAERSGAWGGQHLLLGWAVQRQAVRGGR